MQSAHAGVHVVMVGAFEQEGEYNFTSQITISQTQIDWLIRDLKAVNRLVTPWVVAMIHTVSLLHPPDAQSIAVILYGTPYIRS